MLLKVSDKVGNMDELIQTSEVERLHDQGLTHNEISRALGYSDSWAGNQLRALGINCRNHKLFEPSPEQVNILVGTMLGDGYLSLPNKKSHNTQLSLGHGPTQKSYLCWKIAKFGTLFNAEPCQVEYYNKRNHRVYEAWRCNSRCHPWLTEWRHVFYPEGKKVVTEEILSYVSDLALAIWWCDDGSTQEGSQYVRHSLHVGSLETHEYELVQSWLAMQGFDPNPIPSNHSKSVRFYFRKEGSIHFRERIAPYIPESMLFKFNRHLVEMN